MKRAGLVCRSFGIGLLVSVGCSTVALSQSAPMSKQGASEMDNLGEIVVTARRRDERLQDVPLAISVVTGEQLKRYGAASFENVSTQIPQVMFTKTISGSGADVSIRGIGSNSAGDDSIEQAVSFNIDGVSSARGQLITQALFDLSNVQVLKGPQALYFGKNSPGGVIVVQSNGPGDKWEGYATAGYEYTAREYRVESAIGGPINDSLGVRVALYRSDMNRGYVHNVAQPVDSADSPVPYDKANGINLPGASYEWGPQARQTAGRMTAVFRPNADFAATFKFLGADYRDDGTTSSLVATSCVPGATTSLGLDYGGFLFTGAPAVLSDPNTNCARSRNQSVGSLPAIYAASTPSYDDGQPYYHSRSYLSSIGLEYSLNRLKLTSLTGFYQGAIDEFEPYDLSAFATVPTGQTYHATSWTQELRAATQFDAPVNFVLGGFYSHDHKTITDDVSAARTVAADAGKGIVSTTDDILATGSSASGYFEAIWRILPAVEFDAGARFTHERKQALLDSIYVQPGLISALGLALGQGKQVFATTDENTVNPQATISWKPIEEATVFAGYRTGSKSGGIAEPELIPADATAQNQTFKREKAGGFEAGLKFNALNGRLSGDLTAYDYTFKGLQVVAFNASTNALFILNAGSALTTGIEGSVNFRATHELTLTGAFGYNNARYGSFEGVQCWGGQTAAEGCHNGEQSLTGRGLPRAPKNSGTLGFSWDHPFTDFLATTFGMDARYTSAYFTSPVLSPYAFQGGYTLIDANVRLHALNNRWEVALIGRNLGNRYYVSFSADTPFAVTPGSQYGVLGNPRTIQLTATYRF